MLIRFNVQWFYHFRLFDDILGDAFAARLARVMQRHRKLQDRLLVLGCDALGTTPLKYAVYPCAQMEKMRRAIKVRDARVE